MRQIKLNSLELDCMYAEKWTLVNFMFKRDASVHWKVTTRQTVQLFTMQHCPTKSRKTNFKMLQHVSEITLGVKRKGTYVCPHNVWAFRPFASLQSASGRFRFLVPPSRTTCLSTSHLRRHLRFSDIDSRPFCFLVPTNTLSYDSCVTITIQHYCLDTCGPCNNYLI